MKVYSLDPVSVHQEDKNTTFKAVMPMQGMMHDTPEKLSEVSPDQYAEYISRMNMAEAAHQHEEDVKNNRFSRMITNPEKPNTANINPKEAVKPDNIDVREYVEDGNATTVQTAAGCPNVAKSNSGAGSAPMHSAAGIDESDYCYSFNIPNSDKKMWLYSKCMHSAHDSVHSETEQKGGLIEPEPCEEQGAGISFSEGIAFNDKQLDSILNSLNENKRGGAIPAIVGELALNLIPQIPAIISAIKAKRDDSKIGQGLLNNIQKYDTVRAVMNHLPEGKQASYYNDMIKQFNAFKRSASGISFNDNTYYASGRVMDGLSKFWGWIKEKYNDNKHIFAPIKDALINATNNTIQKGVDNAAKKVTDYVKSKTDNTDIHNIIDATTGVAQRIVDKTKNEINNVGKGVDNERVYSVLN